jgi:cation diffusion facilitator CzcD-associated flavoprotein CzcO
MDRFSVVVIGAGFGGICMAVRLKQAGIDFVLLEKADGVGGTWRANTYPGCACDTESHHYSFSFERNPDWSRVFSGQPEILAYLESCADKYGLREHCRFDTQVIRCVFDEQNQQWQVQTGRGEQFVCRFLVSAVGQLNHPSIPDFPGLGEYRGAVFHTAEWNRDFSFVGKDVAVIGNAASAIQLIPKVARQAKSLKVFQRTANWLIAKNDHAFSPLQKRAFRSVPLLERIYRYFIYWKWEVSWPAFIRDSRVARKLRRDYRSSIAEQVADPELARALTPDYEVGCKRILLSDDYYPAMQRDNVELVTGPIERFTAEGIVTGSGREFRLDGVVMATGFKAWDFLQPVEVIGADGRRLHDAWNGVPEAYLGICVAGFPNLFMLYGPNTNLGHNSIVFMLECQVHYVMKCLKRMRRRGGRSIAVSDDAMDRFNRRLQRQMTKTAWAGGCNSWYKRADGRIINNWSSHTVGYWLRTRRPRWRDFHQN